MSSASRSYSWRASRSPAAVSASGEAKSARNLSEKAVQRVVHSCRLDSIFGSSTPEYRSLRSQTTPAAEEGGAAGCMEVTFERSRSTGYRVLRLWQQRWH